MFKDPSPMSFIKGPINENETIDIKSGKWSSFFGGMPLLGEDPDRIKIAPIAYSLSDFRDQPVKFRNSFNYKIY